MISSPWGPQLRLFEEKAHDRQIAGFPGKTTRRALLAGNIKAVALIAAGALVTGLTPAKADGGEGGDDHGGHKGGPCFLKGTRIQTVLRTPHRRSGCRRCVADGVRRRAPRQMDWKLQTATDASKPWVKDARPVRIQGQELGYASFEPATTRSDPCPVKGPGDELGLSA